MESLLNSCCANSQSRIEGLLVGGRSSGIDPRGLRVGGCGRGHTRPDLRRWNLVSPPGTQQTQPQRIIEYRPLLTSIYTREGYTLRLISILRWAYRRWQLITLLCLWAFCIVRAPSGRTALLGGVFQIKWEHPVEEMGEGSWAEGGKN